MRVLRRRTESAKAQRRRGISTLDYVLVIAVALPMITFIISRGMRMIQLAYEMICVLIAWPFM